MLTVEADGCRMNAEDPSLLIEPLHPVNTAADAILRLRVHNIPSWDVCGLEDLKNFLNGAVARALNLDLYLKYPYGSSIPEHGANVPDPPGTLPAPVCAAGSLNAKKRTCLIDCSFPMATRALINLQGLLCLGCPLIFTRDQTPFLTEAINKNSKNDVKTDATLESSIDIKQEDVEGVKKEGVLAVNQQARYPSALASDDEDDDVELQFSDEEVPAPVEINVSRNYLLTNLTLPHVRSRTILISGISPFAAKGKLEEFLQDVLMEIQGTDDTLVECVWEAQDLRMNLKLGVAICVLKRNVEMIPLLETLSKDELDYQNAREKVLMRSSVDGLARAVTGRLFERGQLFAISVDKYATYALEHKLQVARVFSINPYRPTYDHKAIGGIKYKTDMFFKYSTNTSIYADHLLYGLLQQRSLRWGYRYSKVLQISGLYFPEDVISKDEIIDLLLDLLNTTKPYGQVSLITVISSFVKPDENGGMGELVTPCGAGKVFLEFQDLFGARKTQFYLNGLRFDHTQFISVAFFPEDLYVKKIFSSTKDIMPDAFAESEPWCFFPKNDGLKHVNWGVRGLAIVPDISAAGDLLNAEGNKAPSVLEEEIPSIDQAVVDE